MVATKKCSANNVPSESVEFLRPHAQRAGMGTSDGAVIRFAVIELERRLKAESNGQEPRAKAKNQGG